LYYYLFYDSAVNLYYFFDLYSLAKSLKLQFCFSRYLYYLILYKLITLKDTLDLVIIISCIVSKWENKVKIQICVTQYLLAWFRFLTETSLINMKIVLSLDYNTARLRVTRVNAFKILKSGLEISKLIKYFLIIWYATNTIVFIQKRRK